MSKKTNLESKSEPFRFEVSEESEKGVFIEVSQEDYDRDIANGIPAEELLSPGKHLFRRIPPERRPSPEDLQPRNINVVCELRLKLDILNCLKRLAGSDEMADVERVLNEKLREVLADELGVEKTDDVRHAA